VAAYTVNARPRVRKALRQLDPIVRKNVLAKMRALATDPRPPGSESLRGYSSLKKRSRVKWGPELGF
jgi:hypothetical protein